MKWLTPEQIEKHASTPTKALNISIKHWQQVVDATEKEIREYIGHTSGLILAEHCGLCYFYENCTQPGCSLIQVHGCGSKNPNQWETVADTYGDWLYSGGPFREFKKEARELLRILKSLEGKK